MSKRVLDDDVMAALEQEAVALAARLAKLKALKALIDGNAKLSADISALETELTPRVPEPKPAKRAEPPAKRPAVAESTAQVPTPAQPVSTPAKLDAPAQARQSATSAPQPAATSAPQPAATPAPQPAATPAQPTQARQPVPAPARQTPATATLQLARPPGSVLKSLTIAEPAKPAEIPSFEPGNETSQTAPEDMPFYCPLCYRGMKINGRTAHIASSLHTEKLRDKVGEKPIYCSRAPGCTPKTYTMVARQGSLPCSVQLIAVDGTVIRACTKCGGRE